MRLGKDLVGKPVISITDGRILGTVKDIYVSNDLDWLTGIYLGHEGLLKRKSFLIERDNVVVFGVDAILVKHAEVVTDDRQLPEGERWLRLDKLRRRQVDTPGGTKVGMIGDVTLAEEGRITGFSLARVFVEGPVAEQGMIPHHALIDVGGEDEAMTIDLPKVEQQQEPSQEHEKREEEE